MGYQTRVTSLAIRPYPALSASRNGACWTHWATIPGSLLSIPCSYGWPVHL